MLARARSVRIARVNVRDTTLELLESTDQARNDIFGGLVCEGFLLRQSALISSNSTNYVNARKCSQLCCSSTSWVVTDFVIRLGDGMYAGGSEVA